MPRLQIYLPDDLYEAVKPRGMPISELSQNAVRAALRREQLRAEGQAYLDELVARLGGPPSENELAAADRWIDRASRPAGRHRAS
jgi:post-segregation antitoxin (ccd killing protein)